MPRDLELVLKARPFLFPDSPAQTIRIECNGHDLGILRLSSKMATYRLAVSSAHLIAGRNSLILRYAWARRPLDVLPESSDQRLLAVTFRAIGLHTPNNSDRHLTPLAPRVADTTLLLPYGVQVDYFMKLDPGAELRFDRWRARGGENGRLEIFVQTEGQELTPSAVLTRKPETAVALFGGETPSLVRLRLRASATGLVEEGDGIALGRPEIWARPSPSSSPLTRLALPAPPEELRRQPNILIYLVDTLRADRLGCYGSTAGLTPEIDAFAGNAILFETAIAQSSWTKASVASVFTGMWPVRHGAVKRPNKLAEEAVTLAEMLRDAGYATTAFVANPNVSDRFGFDQGFENFTYYLREDMNPSDELTEKARAWINGRPGDDSRPFFLYLHNIDPHDPYSPPPEYLRRHAAEVPDAFVKNIAKIFGEMTNGRRPVSPKALERLEALYDGDIAYNDQNFGTLINFLRQAELYDDTLILFLSDHGEEFYEHKHLRHGRALFEESTRIPMILKLAGSETDLRIKEPVQHIDILPTLLAYLGLDVPTQVEGRNLFASATAPEAIFSYLHLDGGPRISVRQGRFKLHVHRTGDTLFKHQLYDLVADPGETRDLARSHPVRTGFMASLVRRRLATGEGLAGEEAVIDEKVRQDLEALGYL